MSCVFCKIVERKSPAEIVFETDNIISFLDILPVNLGHTLVIPKLHYKDLTEVPNEIITEVFSTVKYLSPLISEAFKAEGFNVIVNNGAAAGQTVFHSHIHIIPRYSHDRIRFRRPEFMRYENGQFTEYGNTLRNLIQSEQKNG